MYFAQLQAVMPVMTDAAAVDSSNEPVEHPDLDFATARLHEVWAVTPSAARARIDRWIAAAKPPLVQLGRAGGTEDPADWRPVITEPTEHFTKLFAVLEELATTDPLRFGCRYKGESTDTGVECVRRALAFVGTTPGELRKYPKSF